MDGWTDHLARLYAAAEGGLRELVAGCLAEEAQQGEGACLSAWNMAWIVTV